MDGNATVSGEEPENDLDHIFVVLPEQETEMDPDPVF
jgi:hypothetical protein